MTELRTLITSGSGEQTVQIHGDTECAAGFCPFHKPSAHKMVDWPMVIRDDKSFLVERTCEHGVGHDDPDSVAFFKNQGQDWAGIHGCDGCCG